MSYSINGTTIYLTRGDTFCAEISISNADGTPYVPQAGDAVRFALKANYADRAPLIQKDIPTDTMLLTLEPEDTKPLKFGRYVYDIQLTTAAGVVCTFIARAQLIITEEVD